MAPGQVSDLEPGKRRRQPPKANGTQFSRTSTATPTPSTTSSTTEQPPAKKRKLKLNVRPHESPGDTIAVSRPKRDVQFRYSQDMVMEDPFKPEINENAKSPPVPSSGLSSLSSAPSPEIEKASPFLDPEPEAPSNHDAYGDFMSFYVEGGDDEEQPKHSAKPQTRTKAKPKTIPAMQPKKTKQQLTPPTGTTASTKVESPPVQQKSSQPAPSPTTPRQQATQAPPSQQLPSKPQHPSPALPIQGHCESRPPSHPPPPPPPPLPQPLIHFIDIVADSKPSTSDTIATMIRKLEELSLALSNFGTVSRAPATPPPPSAEEGKQATPVGNNPLDNFLSHFGGEEEESEERNFDFVLPSPGAEDSALSYGIKFIQNALKSWAQQRMSHQVTQQWQAHQNVHHPSMQPRRGPGRPRRYEEPDRSVQPVIHMDLANTPEGVAIKAFQSVLDSGCLQMNAVLPTEFARALRHLYMQIDHLINQGSKTEMHWQCMSYGAQIAAHKLQVDRFKAAQAKAQEEMLRQQQLAQHQVMSQMGLQPHQIAPMTAAQAQRHHAIELERRRSLQHAVQQPYISQHHLNPLQLSTQEPHGRPHPAAAPAFVNHTNASSMPPAAPAGSQLVKSSSDGVADLQDGRFHGSSERPGSGPLRVPSATSDGSAAGVHLRQMKLYMPGFLPRSGQSMKFSFAPHNEAAVQMFGTEAFPTRDHGPKIPNRGPMSVAPGQPPPSGAPSTEPNRVSGRATPGDAGSPIDLDADTGAKPEPGAPTPSGISQPHQAPHSARGFTAVNTGTRASQQRRSSRPASSQDATSPGTIKVAQRHPTGSATASASASPAPGRVQVKGSGKVATRASKSVHPDGIGAHTDTIVVDP